MYNLTSNNNITSIIKLIRSLIIKSHAMAVHINIQLSKDYNLQYDPNDMTTWPYYKNLSGLPHDLNTEIEIVSLDTSETIVMDRNIRFSHPKTYIELNTRGNMYNDLISSYPLQELYIVGMLNPIDINKLINAEDGDILYYNNDYLEYNEQSIIPLLENTIKGHMSRWFIEDFILEDDLYMAGYWSILMGYLVNKLYIIKYDNINSYSVGSYFRKTILNSFMGIGSYSWVFPDNVSIWLVKNIKYIASNIGKHSVFELVIDRVFRESNISVSEITLEPQKTDPIPGVAGPTFKVSSDQIYISEYGSNRPKKFSIEELVSYYDMVVSSNVLDITKKLELNTSEITTTFRNIKTKTKFIILKDTYKPPHWIINYKGLFLDIITYIYKENTEINFSLNNGVIIKTTRLEILKAFIYKLMSEYSNVFNVATIKIENLVENVYSLYDLNYSYLQDQFKLIRDNIIYLHKLYNNKYEQQHEINKYILIEYSNLRDDFSRYEFDRYINTMKLNQVIPINVDNTYSNKILDVGASLNDIFESMCYEIGVSVNVSDRVNAFKEILDRLTSYTVKSIPVVDQSDIYMKQNTLLLDGPTIAMVSDATLDCDGAIAQHFQEADTDIVVIERGNNNVLEVVDITDISFSADCYYDNLRPVKDKILLDIIDAGV